MTLSEIKSRVEKILATATPARVYFVSETPYGLCVEYLRKGEVNDWYGQKPGVFFPFDEPVMGINHRLSHLLMIAMQK